MKKISLVLLALVGCAATVVAQPAASKTQKPESARRRAVNLPGSTPNGLLSAAVVAGNLVFTSGQIGLDPKTGQLVEGGTAGQLEQVFKNLSAALEAAGSSTEHILKATVFLADMADYNTMNEIYRKQFKGDPPARTTVQVAALPGGARIEIEAVAVLK
jgi:2-iminobutanoate/2-iminopropanoate deaminase